MTWVDRNGREIPLGSPDAPENLLAAAREEGYWKLAEARRGSWPQQGEYLERGTLSEAHQAIYDRLVRQAM